ncbi:MAG: LON peptidase substrate-binding domain-containing protein [Calditrichaeota bacterium]|nr:LON peptidase substrate-binding domain-containing protein [Calditrichota bacterium]
MERQIIPLFPLDVVLFPQMPLPLHIFEPRYREMIGECLESQKPFGVLFAGEGRLHSVGCTADIMEVLKRYEDGRMDILTRGSRRFLVEAYSEERSFLQGKVRFLEEISPGIDEADADLMQKAVSFLKKILLAVSREADAGGLEKLDAAQLSYLIAASGGFNAGEKQAFLEINAPRERLMRQLELEKTVIDRLEVNKRLTQTMHPNGKL